MTCSMNYSLGCDINVKERILSLTPLSRKPLIILLLRFQLFQAALNKYVRQSSAESRPADKGFRTVFCYECVVSVQFPSSMSCTLIRG